MGTLKQWWRKLAGRGAPAIPRPEPRRTAPPRRTTPNARSADELALIDEPPPRPDRHHGAAGVDPYANDAGFAKPHSWERVDHD